jgi:two-component system sensor histidine kinase CiaH
MTVIKKKLAFITIVYWFLLLYIIAALIWWFVSLEKQNQLMTTLRLSELKKDDPDYYSKYLTIQDASKRKTTQFVGEGITFFVLIMLGAVFVYRAVRKQIRLSQQQQNFMMAITHELKTPIAVTQLNLQTILKRALEPDKQQKLIENTLQETERLNELCNNILFAAQLDAGSINQEKEIVDFSEVVSNSVDSFRRRFSNANLEKHITEGITIEGDRISLEMLVNNLVENAIKYSPKGGPIRINLSKEKHVVFCVADEGTGIPPTEKKKIFDKFYRMGDEITRKAKGTGLGLYICKRIAANHNATISAEDNQPSGTIMKIIFV